MQCQKDKVIVLTYSRGGNWANKRLIKQMFYKIKEFALANKDGFTISLLDFTTPKSGYIVAMNLTQNSFNDEGLKKVIEVAMQSTFLVGGWFNEKEKRFYYDCVMNVQELATAIKLGKANEQIAIYSIDQKKEIFL